MRILVKYNSSIGIYLFVPYNIRSREWEGTYLHCRTNECTVETAVKYYPMVVGSMVVRMRGGGCNFSAVLILNPPETKGAVVVDCLLNSGSWFLDS